MARNVTPPQRPTLTPEQKLHIIGRLKKRVDELEAFNPAVVQQRFGSPNVIALEAAIEETLSAAFGHGTPAYNLYVGAANLDHGPVTMRSDFDRGPRREDMPDVFRGYLIEGKGRAVALLKQAIRGLEEELPNEAVSSRETSDRARNRKVFVVHGRDDGPREAVARFLEHLNFKPVILHEQANQGRTVIEKVEHHSDVGFAVVILTPDDEGALKGEAVQSRARQNVLLELGYLSGSSRESGCAPSRSARWRFRQIGAASSTSRLTRLERGSRPSPANSRPLIMKSIGMRSCDHEPTRHGNLGLPTAGARDGSRRGQPTPLP